MRTSTLNRQWVIGIYATPQEAEGLIHQGEYEGIAAEEFAVIAPEHSQKTFAGIPQERRHPEWHWAAIGALWGFLLASVGAHFLLDFSALSGSTVMDIAMGAIRGFGGAVVGGLFGLLSSGSDTSLNALYEESGIEGKIMVAIQCDKEHPEETLHAEQLILRTGTTPIDFPQRLKKPAMQQ